MNIPYLKMLRSNNETSAIILFEFYIMNSLFDNNYYNLLYVFTISITFASVCEEVRSVKGAHARIIVAKCTNEHVIMNMNNN